MTERELNEIKNILGLNELRTDIKELRNDVRQLEHKISGVWYKLVFVLISLLTGGFLMEILLKVIK